MITFIIFLFLNYNWKLLRSKICLDELSSAFTRIKDERVFSGVDTCLLMSVKLNKAKIINHLQPVNVEFSLFGLSDRSWLFEIAGFDRTGGRVKFKINQS